MKFKIDNFLLERMDVEDVSHLAFEKRLIEKNQDHFVKEMHERLHHPMKKNDYFQLECAYLVSNETDLIGYLYVSGLERNIIYLEYLIVEEYRRKGYASRLIDRVSHYLFTNFPVEKITLDIDMSNYPSMKTAEKAGFYYDEEEYSQGNNRLSFERINPFYKERKRER